MSLVVEMRAIGPFADAPLARIADAGGGWIGDALPLGAEMFGRYPLLSCIDPYGRTVFNSVQAPFLVAELTRWKEEGTSNAEGEALLAKLVSLAQECEREHKALVFIGD